MVALLALAVGAASCTTSPSAATVGGHSISQATLDNQLTAIDSNTDAACVFAAEFDPSGAPVAGAGQGTITATVASTELDNLVLEQLLEDDLARHGRSVTAADITSARSDLSSDVDSSLESDEESGAVPQACSSLTANPVSHLPVTYGHDVARFLALQEAFRALVGHVDISAAGVDAYYQAHPSDFEEACLDLVVADTQAAAQTIDTAIAGGESFAVASSGAGADTSITPPGGELSCQLPTVITDTFGSTDSATIYAGQSGQLLAPMSWTDPETGTTYWLVTKVATLQEAPVAEVASQIRQQLLSGTESSATTALESLLKRADVSIDPAYGSWRGREGLTPPAPPPAADVLNPTANEALALTGG